MLRYIFKRLVILIPIIFIISIITFSLSKLGAGDEARILAEKEYSRPTPQQIEIVRIENGLDKPAYVQYFKWLSRIVKGDFGRSYRTNKPVIREIIGYFPSTIKLSVLALIIVIFTAIPMGIIAAVRPNGIIDYIGRIFSFFSVSVPSFWVGLVLLYFFGVKLKVISIMGGSNQGLIVPAFTLAFGAIGMNIRLVKESMTSVLEKPYMRAVRAKGISKIKLYGKHGLKNALIPVVTKLGIMFSSFLCGASIIESIFSVPGLGKYSLEAVIAKDVPVIQGYVIIIAVIVVAINLIVDILYSFIDPRIKLT